MDWPWAGLRILVAQWSGWTPAPQCCYIPMPHPSQSLPVTLGAHLHCWGRGDLFLGSSPLEREITKVFTQWQTQKLVDKTLPLSSYPGCEESLWTPGSTSAGLLWESPISSGNLYHKRIIWLEQVWVRLQEPQVSPLVTCVAETLFLGAACEVSFDDLTAGVISTTHSTSILLLVWSNLPITTYMLHEETGNQDKWGEARGEETRSGMRRGKERWRKQEEMVERRRRKLDKKKTRERSDERKEGKYERRHKS